MQPAPPQNRHPERPALEGRSTFVLTFLADETGRTTVDELATYLRQRDVVAVVADGDDLGTPGAAVAIIAVDEGGRVVIDAEGRTVSGQQIEHLVPGLAHLTGRNVVVNDEVVIAPDGSESDPEAATLAAGTSACVVMWRASAASAGMIRGLAHGLGAPLEHAAVDGWTIAALPFGSTVDGEALVNEVAGAAERPVVTLTRAGESRAVSWHHRERRTTVTIELAATPATAPVLRNLPPESPSARLAAELGEASLRIVPDTTRLSGSALERLRTLSLARESLLADAADALGLPTGIAAVVERGGAMARELAGHGGSGAAEAVAGGAGRLAETGDAGAAPVRWLDVPGAVVVQPDPTMRAAVLRGLAETAIEEPQGDGAYTRFRRWLWHRPRVLVALSTLEVALGVAVAVWAANGGTVFGQSWVAWLVAAMWVVDGVPDAVAGVVILRRRGRG
ncbi:hypothetical protein ACTVCO_10320 [Sanguibacter sp. A247]|uniref:hypothetical protein n=1 Tax=unclassified Sanguibacter TaxID=2645534 RepID=UPI003FD6EB0D